MQFKKGENNGNMGGNMLKKICFFAGLTALLIQSIAMAEGGGNLWRLADKTGSIKVFVSQPVNESGQGFIADNLKKAVESALSNRR